MNISEIKLPSNRNFGLFFSAIFFILSAYLYLNQTYLFAGLALIIMFLLITLSLFNADLLEPLNKAWMMLGQLLGIVITPLILGIIFFGIFMPIAIFFKIIGRDELKLKLLSKESYWKSVNDKELNFKNQF